MDGNSLSCFDRTYKLTGFNEVQRKEFIQQHLRTDISDVEDVERVILNNTDLGQNPLTLFTMCSLINCSQLEMTRSPTTKSKLYCSLHNMFAEEASSRMELEHAQLYENLLKPLYALAFQSYQKGNFKITERDFEHMPTVANQLCSAGFLNKEGEERGLQETHSKGSHLCTSRSQKSWSPTMFR
jgi:hypothetical protein